jgi:DNA-binding NarL/FixJ family response regulator
VRVALADDSALFRNGLALLLQAAGVTVVASVASGADLELSLSGRDGDGLDLDAVVVDIRMPPTYTDEGLVTARAVRRDHPRVGVLVLSTYVEAAYAVRLLQDGAAGVGYLLKDRVDDVATLLDALQRVAAGGSVVDPDVVAELVRRPRRDPIADLSPASARSWPWSPRATPTPRSPARCT